MSSVTAADTTRTSAVADRAGIGRYIAQPLLCMTVVAACLGYVRFADVSDSEARSLSVSNLLTLLREHLTVSLIATFVTVVLAVPIGVLLTRGALRRYSRLIIAIAGFGQAAPAIGLIALGAAIFGIGTVGATVALVVYGLLPIIVAGVRTALVLIVGTAALVTFTGGGGLGELITSGINLRQNVVLIVGALLIAALALFIDWLARLVELVASPKGV
ncbi:ABC transporter permease [uncultured Aeromicrobium sp.]|uniref:ABC transporter permease n=1 Tax=uncultured Aeromicrobium sp. TaxID=337820 RepID=UPI0025EB66D7|nr:ABC transporter permease [uncultured Aeromicrobium sp.]